MNIEDTILKRNVPGRCQNEYIDEFEDAEGFKIIENNKIQQQQRQNTISYNYDTQHKTGVKGG